MTRYSPRRFGYVALSVTLAALTVCLVARTSVAQSNGEDQELLKAERALLEGLASKGSSPFEKQPSEQPQQPSKSAPAPAELQPATYSGPVEDQSPSSLPSLALEEASGRPTERDLTPRRIEQPHTDESLHEEVHEPAVAVVTSSHSENPLKRDLDASRKRISELERQLEEVRGQLTMAETELSRLATINEARTRATFGGGTPVAAPVVEGKPAQAPAKVEVAHVEPAPAKAADLSIATVNVDKAELRLGPGKNHSALMTIAKGSRLAVEARQGEWLRVFAPNGQRAWIHGKLVAFGSKSATQKSTTTVRVRGYSSSMEDDAFKRVQALTAKQ